MKIKRDKADDLFSKYIRLRDMRCVRCKSPVKLNDKGLPISHQASHFYGRGMKSVRIDPDNVDTLCHGCHVIWGSSDREAYRDYKINQLGEEGFNLLALRARRTTKYDKKLAAIIAQKLLEELWKI